ncbi:hypothetical protein BGZ73_000549 [Actinomortierella ambigua]|nr:hypothetical protein BGZ73_000549 [Actinomortierella ambigua]
MEESRTSGSPFRNILGNIHNLLDQLRDGLDQEKKLLDRRGTGEGSKDSKAKAKAAALGGLGSEEATATPPTISSSSNGHTHHVSIDTTSKKDKSDGDGGPIATSEYRNLGSRTTSKLSSSSNASDKYEGMQVGWWWSGWGHAEDKAKHQPQQTEEDLCATMTPKFIPMSDDRLVIQFETPALATVAAASLDNTPTAGPSDGAQAHEDTEPSGDSNVNDGTKADDELKPGKNHKVNESAKAHEGTTICDTASAPVTTTGHPESLPKYEVTLRIETGYKVEIISCNCPVYNSDTAAHHDKNNSASINEAGAQHSCQHTIATKSMFQRLTKLLQEDSLFAAAASHARSETQTIETAVAGAVHAAKAAKIAKRRRRQKAAVAAAAGLGTGTAFGGTRTPTATHATPSATATLATMPAHQKRPQTSKELRQKMLEMIEAIETVRLKAVQKYTYRKIRDLPGLASTVKNANRSDIVRVEWPSSISPSFPPLSSASSLVRAEEGGGGGGRGADSANQRSYDVTIHWASPGLTGEILQCSCSGSTVGQKSLCEHMALVRAWYPYVRLPQRSSDMTFLSPAASTAAATTTDSDADEADVEDDDADVPPPDPSTSTAATTTTHTAATSTTETPLPAVSTTTTMTTTTEGEPSPTESAPSISTEPGNVPIPTLLSDDPVTLAQQRKVRMLQFLLQSVGGRLEAVDWQRVSDEDQERHAREIWKCIQDLPMLLEE